MPVDTLYEILNIKFPANISVKKLNLNKKLILHNWKYSPGETKREKKSREANPLKESYKVKNKRNENKNNRENICLKHDAFKSACRSFLLPRIRRIWFGKNNSKSIVHTIMRTYKCYSELFIHELFSWHRMMQLLSADKHIIAINGLIVFFFCFELFSFSVNVHTVFMCFMWMRTAPKTVQTINRSVELWNRIKMGERKTEDDEKKRTPTTAPTKIKCTFLFT